LFEASLTEEELRAEGFPLGEVRGDGGVSGMIRVVDGEELRLFLDLSGDGGENQVVVAGGLEVRGIQGRVRCHVHPVDPR